MIQMLASTLVPVAPGRDVEIALDLVHLQVSKDSAAVRGTSDLGSPGPLGPFAAQGHDVVNVLFTKAFLLQVSPAGTSDDAALAVSAQLMYPLLIDPLCPARLVLVQPGACQDAIARGILHIDV
jgi:hypothetical protein